MNSLIQPYHLFGLTPTSTLKKLKKAYYHLCLICHPDRGGNASDMDIVHKAYLYLQKQLANNEETITYEEAEQQFEIFCQEQKETQPPAFSKIYEELDEFNRDFNQKFEKISKTVHNPFAKGYGHLMDTSDRNDDKDDKDDKDDNDHLHPVSNPFSKDIVIYQEPEYLPDTYGTYYNFDVDTVDDFSNDWNDPLQCTDYMKAFNANLTNEYQHVASRTFDSIDDLIHQRETFLNNLQQPSTHVSTHESSTVPLQV